MTRKPKKEKSRPLIAADAFGIVHFVIANLVIFLGEITNIFTRFHPTHGGIHLVVRYIDAPVYSVLKPWYGLEQISDRLYAIVAAEVIVVVSSIFYALLAYILFRIVSLFKEI